MSDIILEVRDVNKAFRNGDRTVTASDHVSFNIHAGEAFGLVGESGCGKSTLAKLITHLHPIDSGELYLCGRDITRVKGRALRETYRDIQMVFQDASASFDPRMKIGDSILEVLNNFGYREPEQRRRVIPMLLEYVGLKPDHANRLPHQLSGGECQRAAIAKAIAIHPKLLICDEATSALDVSVQAQIVSMLKHMGSQMNMAFLFISHDLALVSGFCDRVGVMYRGRMVESGSAAEIIRAPAHPYTRLLLSSVFPVQDYDRWQAPEQFHNEAPDSGGCAFYRRCPRGAACRRREGRLEPIEVSPGHKTLCAPDLARS